MRGLAEGSIDGCGAAMERERRRSTRCRPGKRRGAERRPGRTRGPDDAVRSASSWSVDSSKARASAVRAAMSRTGLSSQKTRLAGAGTRVTGHSREVLSRIASWPVAAVES